MANERRFVAARLVLLGILILVAITLGIVASQNIAIVQFVDSFGYIGVFALSVISGFNVFVPIPVLTFTPVFVAAGLGFWLIIVVASLGMTVGDGLGYAVGAVGKSVTTMPAGQGAENRFIARALSLVERFRRRHVVFPYLLLALYAAFAPAPNEFLVVPMAFMGYRFRYMMPVVFVGNVFFNILVAFGVLGITSFFV